MTLDKTKLAKTLSFAFVSAFAMSSLLLPVAAQAQKGITFTETAGPNGDILTSSNPAAIITGSTDDWNINLNPLGITLSNTGSLPMEWLEGPGEPGVNLLSAAGPGILNLLSEDKITPGGHVCGNTADPLPDGVSCLIGTDASGADWFASVVEHPAAASPEPASVLMMGLGLAGLAIAGIRRKRQS